MNIDGQPPHIVVVSDDPDILVLKQEVLEDEGFRATIGVIGDMTLDEILGLLPDLVIIGYSSQAELDLLWEIAGEPSLCEVPLVLCTGAVRQVEAIRRELDARGIAIVFKPFDIHHLIDIVRRQLGMSSTSGGAFSASFG